MSELDDVEQRRAELLELQRRMKAKQAAQPNDYGVRVWWGFVIIGGLLGWLMLGLGWSMLINVFAFWLAGMLFSIFALDSAEVQSKVALFLYQKLREKRLSAWLYNRALTIR